MGKEEYPDMIPKEVFSAEELVCYNRFIKALAQIIVEQQENKTDGKEF